MRLERTRPERTHVKQRRAGEHAAVPQRRQRVEPEEGVGPPGLVRPSGWVSAGSSASKGVDGPLEEDVRDAPCEVEEQLLYGDQHPVSAELDEQRDRVDRVQVAAEGGARRRVRGIQGRE